MNNKVKRGRPRKNVNNSNVTFSVNTVKMNDLSFNDNLFNPMKTKTRVDQFFSNEGGIMPGVNYVGTGNPGVGKTTVLLDILADVKNSGKKCLFISGEMNAIDMVGYVKRFPKFGDLDILFMGDYSEVNPDVVPPGGEAEITITLENRADSYLRAIKAELDVSDDTIPFSPIDSTTEKSIYQIPPRTIQSLKFTLISLPDADAKTYKIPLKIDFEDELGNKFNKSTLIGIKIGTIPDVELFIDEADFFKPKTKGRVIAQLVNKGLIDIKFATIKLRESNLYEMLSPGDIYLGEIESDDFETAEFEIFMNTKQKDVPLVFDVTYLDANNNEFKQSYTEMIKVFDNSEAKEFGIEGSGKFGFFIMIIIVVGGLLLYRYYKKRKK